MHPIYLFKHRRKKRRGGEGWCPRTYATLNLNTCLATETRLLFYAQRRIWRGSRCSSPASDVAVVMSALPLSPTLLGATPADSHANDVRGGQPLPPRPESTSRQFRRVFTICLRGEQASRNVSGLRGIICTQIAHGIRREVPLVGICSVARQTEVGGISHEVSVPGRNAGNVEITSSGGPRNWRAPFMFQTSAYADAATSAPRCSTRVTKIAKVQAETPDLAGLLSRDGTTVLVCL